MCSEGRGVRCMRAAGGGGRDRCRRGAGIDASGGGLRREESQRVPAGGGPWEKHCRTECLPAAQKNLSPRRRNCAILQNDALVFANFRQNNEKQQAQVLFENKDLIF